MMLPESAKNKIEQLWLDVIAGGVSQLLNRASLLKKKRLWKIVTIYQSINIKRLNI